MERGPSYSVLDFMRDDREEEGEMSKLEDKAVEVIDKSMIGVERLTEKMAELAAQYGPDVVDAGMQVVRLNAIQSQLVNVVFGVPATIAAIVYIRKAIKLWQQSHAWDACYFGSLHNRKETSSIMGYDDPEGAAWAASIVGGISSVISIASIYCFLNIWNWVGIVEPKLWIAHRILEKAL